MSNAMAVLLQSLSARLGIVTGRDLAQTCRDHYPRSVNYILWILAEIAIEACDLAEVLETAIGLNLLLGIPLLWGVVVTGFDTMLFLATRPIADLIRLLHERRRATPWLLTVGSQATGLYWLSGTTAIDSEVECAVNLNSQK